MRSTVILACLCGIAHAQPLEREGATLTLCGEPVRLVGYGHYGQLTERDFDYEAYLDLLVDPHGLNLVRIWGHYQWTRDLMPWAGTRGDRDLLAFDEAYWTRLRALAGAAAARGVVVMFTLFDSVMLEGSRNDGNRWINSPYRRANNRQDYLRDPRDFNALAGDPPVWVEVNQPYIERAVDTLCDLPNILYEVMNEPDGSGAEPGLGTPAFVDAVITELHRLLQRDRCTGSRLIATNDNPLRTAADPRVDLVAVHVDPDRANDYANLGKPVMVSNDGDRSQVSNAHGFGDLDQPARATRITDYARNAFGDGSPTGHIHLEILDKDFHGASWLSQDYQPRVANRTDALLRALTPFATTPPRTCAPPPPEPDAGIPDASPDDATVPDAAEPAPDTAVPASDAAVPAPDAGPTPDARGDATEAGSGGSSGCRSAPTTLLLWLPLLARRRRSRRS